MTFFVPLKFKIGFRNTKSVRLDIDIYQPLHSLNMAWLSFLKSFCKKVNHFWLSIKYIDAFEYICTYYNLGKYFKTQDEWKV